MNTSACGHTYLLLGRCVRYAACTKNASDSALCRLKGRQVEAQKCALCHEAAPGKLACPSKVIGIHFEGEVHMRFSKCIYNVRMRGRSSSNWHYKAVISKRSVLLSVRRSYDRNVSMAEHSVARTCAKGVPFLHLGPGILRITRSISRGPTAGAFGKGGEMTTFESMHAYSVYTRTCLTQISCFRSLTFLAHFALHQARAKVSEPPTHWTRIVFHTVFLTSIASRYLSASLRKNL
jgi:hypothetical protein